MTDTTGISRILTLVFTDLGVRYVVEGSVRKSANRVRIPAQLIDATSGEHVWADTYDRELTDVFAVQGRDGARRRSAHPGSPAPGWDRVRFP